MKKYKHIQLTISDSDTDYLKLKKGMTIIDIVKDYTSKGKCQVTLTIEEQPDKRELLEQKLRDVETAIKEAMRCEDGFGILQGKLKKLDIETELSKIEGSRN